MVISRTGWTAVPGFEVNLLDGSRGDDLWNAIMNAGEEFGIRPDRALGGASDRGGHLQLRLRHHPERHAVPRDGLERLVEDQPQDYIGKDALERLRRDGVDRKLVGIEWEGEELRAELSRVWDASVDGKQVGHLTDAVWSPGLGKNIGYVWVPIGLAEPGTKLDVETEAGGAHRGHDRRDPVRGPAEGASRRLP